MDTANKLEGYYQHALKYANEAEFEIAIDMVNKMHALSPNNDQIYLTGAAIKLTGKDYLGCIEDSKKCIEINPKNIAGWNHLGSGYCEMNNFEKGLQAFKNGIDLGSDDSLTLYNHWIENM